MLTIPGVNTAMGFGQEAGLAGIVTKVRSEYRLVISVSLLQRSVAVEIDREDVQRSPQQPAKSS